MLVVIQGKTEESVNVIHQVQKVIKEILGLIERLQMAADLNMVDNKIIHSATPCDADDAVNKSYVKNNLLKTD